MINKAALQKRLDKMVELAPDWDGFDSQPITDKVHHTATRMLDSLSEAVFGMQIFVGVITPGSLYIEFDLNHKLVEVTISPDGMMFCEEYMAGVHCGSAVFVPDADKLREILER